MLSTTRTGPGRNFSQPRTSLLEEPCIHPSNSELSHVCRYILGNKLSFRLEHISNISHSCYPVEIGLRKGDSRPSLSGSVPSFLHPSSLPRPLSFIPSFLRQSYRISAVTSKGESASIQSKDKNLTRRLSLHFLLLLS